jgi:sterol desaturase/sphingolipid hydroxylase (fatty acid hydroxylase superfamily)
MSFQTFLSDALAPSNFATMGVLFGLMSVLALAELVVPLTARDRSGRPHAFPNLALTMLTFGFGLFFGAAILLLLAWQQAVGFGLLNAYGVAPVLALAGGVLALDLATYLCHVALHKVPAWWAFHRVHHSDPAVDVTTSFRQHPGETLIRYAFLVAAGSALGVSPVAFAIYRTLSAVSALFEHANMRVPPRLDDVLSLVVTWPTLHKVHHSRDARETDTNYGNIFSIWDRLFFTFTPAAKGRAVLYGLDGFDDVRDQALAGLLAMPFRRRPRVEVLAEKPSGVL